MSMPEHDDKHAPPDRGLLAVFRRMVEAVSPRDDSHEWCGTFKWNQVPWQYPFERPQPKKESKSDS